MKTSAGLLMFRKRADVEPHHIEILLVHPGGPFWQKKDDGVWDIPKGQQDDGEDLLETAKREFEEETGVKPTGPFYPVGSVKRSDKTVHVWAFEGDCNPANIRSNMISIEWPPKSGKQLAIPEVDYGGFFTLADAERKVWPYLKPIIEMFSNLQSTWNS